MSKSLAVALEKRDKAEQNVEKVLRRDYPVGSEVTWKRNGIHRGVVVHEGSGDRVKVKNDKSGFEYWIYAYCIVDAVA